MAGETSTNISKCDAQLFKKFRKVSDCGLIIFMGLDIKDSDIDGDKESPTARMHWFTCDEISLITRSVREKLFNILLMPSLEEKFKNLLEQIGNSIRVYSLALNFNDCPALPWRAHPYNASLTHPPAIPWWVITILFLSRRKAMDVAQSRNKPFDDLRDRKKMPADKLKLFKKLIWKFNGFCHNHLLYTPV